MSVVRVVARIRPNHSTEPENHNIVEAVQAPVDSNGRPTTLSIPNPKQSAEKFSFQFNSVYESHATQQDLFEAEVAPTVKHLFSGFDVTIFAYGVTGTGKTHTMRGGKALADRGVIPRLLSSIYRRGRKIEKDSTKRVEVSMSYYEIYNDRVFDLFEPPEKRTLAGLPIREANGKTIVANLTERPCTTLKEFEQLYDEANLNRSTSATKLNAHSSRSHAILAVKVAQIDEDHTVISTASAIDLAGSEDNRRTDNSKERLVESSSINRSLFVLAQCVEAISKKQSRIPYRESKMTRILSLGQNQGFTLMILNIAPLKSYHLDTLSSLNFANRTKKIEIRDIENEPVYKGKEYSSKPAPISAQSIQRQPLKAIPSSTNNALKSVAAPKDKPVKSFSVYAEKAKTARLSSPRTSAGLKRGSDAINPTESRVSKSLKPTGVSRFGGPRQPEISRSSLEELVNRMVDEKLAKQTLAEAEKNTTAPALGEEVQKRLEALEQRVEKKEDSRAEGLQYLLMAKQHQVRGEDSSALKMYQLALPFFPENEKLTQRMLVLQDKIHSRREGNYSEASDDIYKPPQEVDDASDDEYRQDANPKSDDDDDEYVSDAAFKYRPKLKPHARKLKVSKMEEFNDGPLTPRSSRLINIINTRDASQIRALKGVGAKKAESIVSCLCEMDSPEEDAQLITDLRQLGALKGISYKLVENMRAGITI